MSSELELKFRHSTSTIGKMKYPKVIVPTNNLFRYITHGYKDGDVR